ncbi:MAG: cytochrome C oxidase subunit I [Burkholderiaceae bacterium]
MDMPNANSTKAATEHDVIRANRIKMLSIFAVFLAPVVAAYVAYFFMPPSGRTNYGDLIDPQRPSQAFALAPAAGVSGDVGADASIGRWRGKWIMVVTAPSACDSACARLLYLMRQVRLTTGRDRDRVERLWILPDGQSPDAKLLAEHDGLHLGRARPGAIAAHFPVPPGGLPDRHIYLIDPLGNLMMRFPSDPDPTRMKKDLLKLLKISQIG